MLHFFAKPRNQVVFLLVASLLFTFIIRPWQLYFLNDEFFHIPMPNQFLILRSGFLRPMPNFLLLFDKWLYGQNALGFFVTSLILHTLCVFAVYGLVKQIVKTFFAESKLALWPFFTALLFLCYPFHAEPIMWVIGRVSILATIFALLSLRFYLMSATKKSWIFPSLICFVLALFTYESIWNLPLLFTIVSCLIVIAKKSTLKVEVIKAGAACLIFGAYVYLRFKILGTIAGEGYPEINENLGKISLLLTNLVKLTGRNFTPPFPDTRLVVLFFGLSLLFYGWLFFKAYKKEKVHGLVIILLCVCLVSGVVTACTLGIDTHYNESERYIYYSSFFYCVLLAYLMLIFLKTKRALVVLSIFCLLFLVYLYKIQGNYNYASSITRGTVEMVTLYPKKGRLIFIDVPSNYKGTMIFRVGLPEAIDWLVPQNSYDTVIVHSQVSLLNASSPFLKQEVDWQSLARQKGWPENEAILPDSTRTKMDRLLPSDQIFWFTQKGLAKINLQAKP